MDFTDVERAFCDELQKIGASNMHVPQTRTGRRSISVDNLLKKDKEGKLFKHAPKPEVEKLAFGTGSSVNLAPAMPFNMDYTAGPLTGAEAKVKRKKGEPPSREDVDTPKTVDARANATVIPGSGTQWTDVAASNPSL